MSVRSAMRKSWVLELTLLVTIVGVLTVYVPPTLDDPLRA